VTVIAVRVADCERSRAQPEPSPPEVLQTTDAEVAERSVAQLTVTEVVVRSVRYGARVSWGAKAPVS